MRRIRYQVACSLDGYIAGPNGEFDWIPMDPDIDFQALYDEFDTFLMGRRTYEELPESSSDAEVVVVSRTLRQEEHPGVTIVSERVREVVDELRARRTSALRSPDSASFRSRGSCCSITTSSTPGARARSTLPRVGPRP